VIRALRDTINYSTHGILHQFPGVDFGEYDRTDDEPQAQAQAVHPRQLELANWSRDLDKFQLIFPLRNLKRIRSVALILRNILEGQWDDDAFQVIFENRDEFLFFSDRHKYLLPQQVLLLQDLSQGGGLAFTVVLFFHALRQLLSMSSSKETHSALYIATFRAITSDWSKYKHSLGTQNVLLDMVVPGRDVVGFISSDDCPAYIENEFLVLLGNILEGQKGPHIDDAVQVITRYCSFSSSSSSQHMDVLNRKALRVITRARRSSL